MTNDEMTNDGVFEAVACPVCGCVCDDLRVTVELGRITRAEGACRLAEPWFLTQPGVQAPPALVEGRPVPLEVALDRAVAILRASRAPLVYGLSRSSTAGQQAAVRLADFLGATIDTTASLGHAPAILALQEVGESVCTLGEVRNRADLVIFWGSDPVESHPRHFERYSVDPTGEWTPHGRPDRTVVVVDVRPTATSARADLFLPVQPGRDFEALWALRALIRAGAAGESPGHPADPGADHGMPLPLLADLARRMKACRFGIIFFGLGLSRNGHRTVAALLSLVLDLNDYTRFYARRMRVSGDVAGADSVLCWQTGYPFSVNLARGYPRYNPGEFTANNLLERGEVDACLLVGSHGLRRLSPAALERLRSLPAIVLDAAATEQRFTPAVRITTAVYGLHRPGTAYRMDEVPIPLSGVLPSDLPDDETVLTALLDRLRGRGR
jgi:formylmethanofuran dehydrogenase subunit B